MMSGSSGDKKLKGVRRRKWGKWVSEIRVPGTQERLWLGTYATPEAAAVAHDVAVFCLRRPSTLDKLNFPETILSSYCNHQRDQMSPRSVQKVASNAGMEVDARNIIAAASQTDQTNHQCQTPTNVRTHVENHDHVRDALFCGDAPSPLCNSDVWWWNDDGQGSREDCREEEEETLSISVEDYL